MDDIKQKNSIYLNNLFDTEHFVVKKRKNIEDSLEIYIKDEFLGLIYEEIDENEKPINFI